MKRKKNPKIDSLGGTQLRKKRLKGASVGGLSCLREKGWCRITNPSTPISEGADPLRTEL